MNVFNSVFDSVLIIGFGGPTKENDCRCEPPCPTAAHCFVKGILGDSPSRRKRLLEVAERYATLLKGESPFNALTFRQADAIKEALAERNIRVPIHVGMRNWAPRFAQVLATMASQGLRRALGVIMSPLQCHESWERYMEDIAAARRRDPRAPCVDYLPFWGDKRGYIESLAERSRGAFKRIPLERRESAALVFTAHAIPVPAASRSPYVAQFHASAKEAARVLGKPSYELAYQSGVYDTPLPWLVPDVNDVLRALPQSGVHDVVVVPAGFVCDHMEVLYDLDVTARRTAEACGIDFYRAETAGTHPMFIRMLADSIAERMAHE